MKQTYLVQVKYYLMIGLLIGMAGSCKKFLDKKQNTVLVTPSSLSDAQALLDATPYMNEQHTPSYGEASVDGFFMKDADYNASVIQYQSVYTWRYYPFQAGAEDWSAGYQPVYYANLAMDLLRDIERTTANQEAWDNVQGSALFFRSYYFLCLLWNYAKAYDSSTADRDLGIALRLTSDFNVPSTRAYNQECYQRVISDTKAAIPLLPIYPQHVMRPSKIGAYGLLARCYLSMRDYKDALSYADSCLQFFSALMDYNADADIVGGVSGTRPFKRFNKETVFYSEMDGRPSIYYSSRSRTDTSLYASYGANDLRKAAYFSTNTDGYHQFKGSYAGSSICFSGIATDEMYLVRAECLVRMGQIQEGLSDLDNLLAKRYQSGTYVPANGLNQTDALSLILNERTKELTLRGLRWMDIKRLNKESRNIVLKRLVNGNEITLLPNANFYALPLPADIIQLTGIPQNDL